MRDYYPLIVRAIAKLEENNSKSRAMVYEVVRKTLIDQLHKFDPPLDEWRVTREREALEEAIRRVETEATRLDPHPVEQKRPPQGQERSPAAARKLALASQLPSEVRVVGVPGEFTNWGLDVVRQLLETHGAVVIVESHNDVRSDTIESPGSIRLTLVDALQVTPDAEESAPTLLFLDDPFLVLQRLLSAGADTVAAIRGLTAALSRMATLRWRNETLLVDRTILTSPSDLLFAVAKHLFSRFSGDLPKLPFLPGTDSMQLSPEVMTMARQVLEPMTQMIRGLASGPIVWPLACFYDGSRPNHPAPWEVEVQGPSRILTYGPYFHLPSGMWLVTALLSFSEDACANRYLIDVFGKAVLAKTQLQPREPGEWQVSFKFENPRWLQPIEIRLWLDQGAIEGRVRFIQAELELMA